MAPPDPTSDRPSRRRGPSSDFLERRRVGKFLAPIVERLGDWQERAARLHAVALARRGTTAHTEAAAQLLEEIELTEASLKSSLLDGASDLARSSQVRDALGALASAAAVARHALRLLESPP